MGTETQLWVQLAAQAAEAMVWLLLTAWCLERLRTHLWARLAAVGAVLLFIPATTLTAGRAQLMFGDSVMILDNYAHSSLPTAYALLRVVAAMLLLAALLVGRGVARPIPA
jgi:hypothetical protein